MGSRHLLALIIFSTLFLTARDVHAQSCSAETANEATITKLTDKILGACCGRATVKLRKSCLNTSLSYLSKAKAFLGTAVYTPIRASVREVVASIARGGACPVTSGGSDSFKITAIQNPGIVASGSTADIRVTYSGVFRYPITAVYDLNPIYGRAPHSTDCQPGFPAGFQCGRAVQLLTTESLDRTFTFEKAQGCVTSTDVYFDYVVYLRDGAGNETAPVAAPFTCDAP